MKEIIAAIKTFFPTIRDFFELSGIVIITVGTLLAMYNYLYNLILKKEDSITRFNKFKISVGRSIATGLELTVVADLINTTTDVTYHSLGILLILVIIRTIIGYFLNKDLEIMPDNIINSK